MIRITLTGTPRWAESPAATPPMRRPLVGRTSGGRGAGIRKIGGCGIASLGSVLVVTHPS